VRTFKGVNGTHSLPYEGVNGTHSVPYEANTKQLGRASVLPLPDACPARLFLFLLQLEAAHQLQLQILRQGGVMA
jgi:hypothetical protein